MNDDIVLEQTTRTHDRVRVTITKDSRERDLVSTLKEVRVSHQALADSDGSVQIEGWEEAREHNVEPPPPRQSLERDARVAPPRVVPESRHGARGVWCNSTNSVVLRSLSLN